MALAVSIGGVDALDYLHLGDGNPGIDWGLQARTVARLTLKDRAGVYRPTLRAPVLIDLDGTRIFGGVLTHVTEHDWGDYVGNWLTVEAADWTTILETMPFNGIAVGPTLRDLLVDVITRRIGVRGFTLHPDQAAGPTLGSLGYSFAYINDIFDDWARISGWVWTIDPLQRILFTPPDGRPAPFALRADNATIHTIATIGDLNGYVNLVWLHYGAPGPREVTETWQGDGVRREFPAREFPQPEGILSGPPTVLVNGVTETASVVGGDAASWYWRASDATLVSDAARATLGPAEVLSWIEVANFPGAINVGNAAELAAYGEFAIVVTDTGTFDLSQAYDVANGILRERGGLTQHLQVVTPVPGLMPGHVVTVDVPERNLDERPCLIVNSRLLHAGRTGADAADQWRFDLELVEGAVYGESWQKFFKALDQGTGTGVSASGAVGPPPSGGTGGGGVTVGGFGPTYAGGSRVVTVAGTAAWTPIAELVDVLLPAGTASMAVYTCRCHAWTNGGGTINVRVVALDGTACGTSTAKAASTWSQAEAFHDFDFTLRPATHFYRVELQVSAATVEGFVAGCVFYPKGAA